MVNAEDFVQKVQAALEPLSNPGQAPAMQKYMKDRFDFLGIKRPARTEATRPLLRQLQPQEALPAAQHLWTLTGREYQYVAVDILAKHVKMLSPEDLSAIRALIQTHSWWDTVDLLASKVVGGLVRRHPELKAEMDRWSEDPDFWVRRTAVLHQLSFKKETDQERLFAFALKNAPDAEFFIRKAIGWALREHAKTSPEAVRTFVEAHRAQFSGLTIREAFKHF
ncbi:DNA alkylation repair protein [Deinococcus cellulosilyticus]|uniref:DNA alkylation repair protein n=1 Tax=Deinococcus cellulosilyticus (strain DSM 18568 / NBRC 106333 / KACC 11606 / 5516J-15) TaxID=1223518 RepID=A0A511N4V3_DEIC1|nr:DNA alkylation repair protein [Deinococcus cellulosilyticus]GEM47880.1 hypothetical protein DC3_35150 [Deinococcus cellulosilyticus NBRC 106333 = KACC 11606]